LDSTTVDASSIYIADENNLPITAVLKVSEEKVSIIPYEFFLPNQQYTIIVTTAVKDNLGRTLEKTFTYTFITASLPDEIPPSLLSVTPEDGIQAPVTTDIFMEFDENIAGDGALQLTNSDTNSTVNGTSMIRDNTLHFVPYNNLNKDSNYTITLLGTVEDLAGNAYSGLTSWNFSVLPEYDLIPPSLLSVTPTDGTQAAKTTDILMEFDENIAGDGVLQLKENDTNTTVNGTTVISNNTLYFVPQNDLIQGNNYTVTLLGTVEDLTGNVYSGPTSWNFSVLPASDLIAVSVTYSGRVIRVEFSEHIDPSTVHESDFAINGGSITFDHLILQDETTVKFIADTRISGTEEISVSGTIQDIYGISHNNGVTAIYTLGE
ncbi:MAG: Ig-like domain-containing protein, partial [Chloroflexota bacterium]|nr:Ig-like domain-containing protein [Chloroflexota bacterium]